MTSGPAPGGDLLIVAESHDRTPAALSLRSRQVRIVSSAAGVHESFETVAVEPATYAAGWLEAEIEASQHRVRPGGRLLLLLPIDRIPAPEQMPRLTGLDWGGLGLLDEHLMVRLIPSGATGSRPDELLATALLAARLASRSASAQAVAQGHRAAARVVAAHADARLVSELNLLDRLAALTDQVAELEQRHRGTALIRTVVGRSRLGQVLRPAVGWARRSGRAIVRRDPNGPGDVSA